MPVLPPAEDVSVADVADAALELLPGNTPLLLLLLLRLLLDPDPVLSFPL